MPSVKKDLVPFSEHREKKDEEEEKVCVHPRIVVLGSTGVGKTSIVQQFFFQTFPTSHIPTVEEMYNSVFVEAGSALSVDVLDTSGYYEFPAMRRLAIRTADAFVLVYAVDDADSFRQVSALRDLVLEVRGREDLPIVVVGNKCDLGCDARALSRTVAESVVTIDWEHRFVEASAKTNLNVAQIFREVVLLAEQEARAGGGPAAADRRRTSCPLPARCPKVKQALAQKRHSCTVQ